MKADPVEPDNIDSPNESDKFCEIKLLFKAIDEKKYDEVQRLLVSSSISVNSVDEMGMTPLQQAAFKGDLHLCQLFIDHGAKVNDDRHQYMYTALMFAALAGSLPVVKLLLENGADSSVQNKIQRTAAQLASFVGKPEIASFIENFFSKDEIAKICQIKNSKDGMPLLRDDLVSQLYNISISVNLNPVFLSMQLQQMVGLVEESDRVIGILENLVDDMMKRKATDEPAALRFHYILTLIKSFNNFQKKNSEKTSDLKEAIELWTKHLVRARDHADMLVAQESIARDTLCSFPYKESRLLQQAVRSMMDTKLVPKSVIVSPLSVLHNAIHGQRMKPDGKQCETCGEMGAKLCQVCQNVSYCNKTCQKLNWGHHKKLCIKKSNIISNDDRGAGDNRVAGENIDGRAVDDNCLVNSGGDEEAS